MNELNLRKPILSALAFFIIASLLGLALRFAFVLEYPEWFMYRNVQHAHSHTALLGWLFAIYYLGIIHFFELDFERYKKLFYFLQVAVLGMLVSFPINGYSTISIIFSTAHIMLCFVFTYMIWKEKIARSRLSQLFLKTSLAFLCISTLGPLALGPLMSVGLKGTALYYGAIQFYLHFQFNGWFIFGGIAILLAIIEWKNIKLNEVKEMRFYKTLLIATILTFALAVTWSTPHWSIFLLNSIGVLVQLWALLLFIQLIRDLNIKEYIPKYTFLVFSVAMLAFFLKVFIQSIVVIPYFAEVSYMIRNFVIGFIHLLMLGCLSLFAFGFISIILRKSLSYIGTQIFIAGIVITELLLFGQGLMLWQELGFLSNYYLFISLGSAAIILGLIIIFFNLHKSTKPDNTYESF